MIAAKVRSELKKFRIKHEDGNFSNWFELDLVDTIICIDKIIYECDDNNQ